MIKVVDLSKHFGDQVLFEQVSFQIGSRERIGLVGRNGSGKSTLFKLILNELSPDKGEIQIPKGYKFGALSQHLHFSKKTVREECTQVLNPDDFNEFEAEKILFGLGFATEDLDRDPLSFSGGYQIRINLAKVLLIQPDLLLLDEPTNYLDIISMRWLQNFLKAFPGEILLITHDRDFMDDVVTHTMGLHRKKLKKVKGDTAKFYEKILEEEEIYEKTRENLDKKRREMVSFVERFKAKASKAKQAQSRMKQLDKMGQMDELAKEANLGFRFQYSDCSAKELFHAKHLAFSYDQTEANQLFHQLSFSLGKNDRLAIIGKNGKGKSTLLNVIAGELAPLAGKTSFHPNAKIGHFGQTNINRLDLERTIVDEISCENGDLPYSTVRNICGSMMFEGDLALKKIKVLSGGERARVLLGKILARPCNLLLLDEPTNHLDLESIESLTEEIARFPGAVIIVTHSEMMLRNLANKLIIFHQNNAEYFPGTYDEFLEKIGWETEVSKAQVPVLKLSEKERKLLRSDLILKRAEKRRPLEEEISQLEADISKNEDLVKRLSGELERSETMADQQKLNDYTHAIGKLNSMIDELFEKLTNATENLDFINQHYSQELEKIEA